MSCRCIFFFSCKIQPWLKRSNEIFSDTKWGNSSLSKELLRIVGIRDNGIQKKKKKTVLWLKVKPLLPQGLMYSDQEWEAN